METSLRCNRDSKSLRLHAKEKFPIDAFTSLQVHGELDTKFAVPSYFSAILRHSYPKLYANLGLGVQYSKHEKLRYTVRGKQSFPVTSDDLIRFTIKGRCDADKEFKERKSKGAAEFTWMVFNFQQDQDVRFKVGYDIIDKVPYMQVRENNWSINADAKGRWSIRYDL